MTYDIESLFKEMTERYYPDISAYGIDFYSLQKAICKRESNFDPSNVTPEKDGDYSIGLMQIKIATARGLYDFGSKSDAEVKSMLLGAKFNLYLAGMLLVKLIKRYNGNLKFVVSAYNAGTAMFFIDGKIIYWDPRGFFQSIGGVRIPAAGYDESMLESYKIYNSDYVAYVLKAYNEYSSGTATEKKTL